MMKAAAPPLPPGGMHHPNAPGAPALGQAPSGQEAPGTSTAAAPSGKKSNDMSSKIMHPTDDLSLEEMRAMLPKYQLGSMMGRQQQQQSGYPAGGHYAAPPMPPHGPGQGMQMAGGPGMMRPGPAAAAPQPHFVGQGVRY